MDDTQHTIGLSALLDEVDHDLDELRKKHATDYGVKGISMWWEMERERLLTRHSPQSVVKKLRRVQGLKRLMLGFFTGAITLLVADTVIRLVIG